MSELLQRIFVAFDTETTGLLPHRSHVVEIAGIRFLGGGDEISRFATLANPGERIAPEVTNIHGISDTMVARAPSSAEACRQFSGWIGRDDVLIAHNASFDVAFIAAELLRGGLAGPKNPVVDTLKCFRWLAPPVRDFKLKTLVEYYGLPETGYHRALADSLHVAALFEIFRESAGIDTLDDLLRIGGVPTHYDMGIGRSAAHPRFAHLSEIIDRGEILALRYEGGPKAGTPRRILPIRFYSKDGTEFLAAQCLSSGCVEHFHLDRVIELSPAARR